MYDLIVLGGGAAGLAATAYALGKQLKVLAIYEHLGGKAGQHLGLQATAEEADYAIGHTLVHLSTTTERPLGEAQYAGGELVQLFKRQLRAHPEISMDDRVQKIVPAQDGFEVQTANHGTQYAAAVIVATGVRPRRLDVPGAAQLVEHGLGYSPSTYARQVEGLRVAVIGSTTRALRGAAELVPSAAEINLITQEETVVGSPLLETLRTQSNVAVLEGYEVVSIEGASQVEQVILARHGQRRALPVDVVFVALGIAPNSQPVHELVRLNGEGFIQVDERNATSVPGLFAAGDVTTNLGEQVLIAVGDGARAALSAYDYILNRSLLQSLEARD